MVQSRAWNWKEAEKERWLIPSEDCVFLQKKWQAEGARSVLDLGCGLGRHAFYFAENGFSVTAVDLSEEAINYVTEKAEEKDLRIVCKIADMTALPFDAHSFDRVFSYHVISHQDTTGVQKVIDEIARVLKPGGSVFLTLCSKEHFAFTEEIFPKLDDNTVLKTEGAEVDVPHFFADKEIIKELFRDYRLLQVRHITDCAMENGEKERSHYFIEAAVEESEYMNETEELQKIVARIRQMEQYFDEIKGETKKDSKAVYKDEALQKKWQTLLTYYEGGQWLKDYGRDERGELPKGLKRGVLSQDGVYNLISEIET